MNKSHFDKHKSDCKINESDDSFVKKCLHDITNFRIFDFKTLSRINNLPWDDRMKILDKYNKMFEYVSEIVK